MIDLPSLRYFAHPKNGELFYFSSASQPSIYKVLGTSMLELFHTAYQVRFMEVTDDGQTLVFASDNGVRSIRPKDADVPGSDKLLANELQAVGVAIDGGFVYYTNIAGGISRVPLGGGPIEVIFDALPTPPTVVGDIDVANGAAYWSADGKLYRLAL